jgi:uncharacterized tellurite resistance protein B-like protein
VLTRWLQKLGAAGLGAKSHLAKPLQHAMAELLLEVGRADFEVDEAELKTAHALLKTRFDLNDEQVTQALDQALEESERSISIYPLLRTINEQATPQDKAGIIGELWSMAYANGEIDAHEEGQIRRIADLLYVPHRVFIRAKHGAEKRRGLASG